MEDSIVFRTVVLVSFFTAALWKMVSALRCGCAGQTQQGCPLHLL